MTHTTAVERLLDVRTIYLEPAVEDFTRGREVLQRFPDAERIEVASHWQIPGLYGNEGNVRDWTRIKRQVLVLGVKKSLTARPNGRSSDFIAPSTANGCAMACAYPRLFAQLPDRPVVAPRKSPPGLGECVF